MNQAHDDDGIIDLRALASTPPARGAFPMASPFSSDPPPAFTRDADEDGGAPRRSKAKTIGMIAAAGAFVVLGCVGVAFAFRGPKVSASSASLAAPPPPAPVVVAPPAPAADPAPAPATASADDSTPASDATSAKKTKAGKGGARTTTKSAAAFTKPAAASKAADPCNCHGDFQCNIRCAAKK